MDIIITAVLNTVAYQHKTQAASVVSEPESRPFNPSHLRHFPKDPEEDKSSFGITGTSKIAAKPGDLIKE